jgi:hypothetical protein
MPKPEILRRCSSCGAASRPGESFCAQCGNPVAKGASVQRATPAEETAVENDSVLVLPGREPRGQRFAPRGAIGEKMKPGVDKLRRVSSVVLDEAAYDTSLRFILVVGIIFALFLLLLFLSKWIS